MPIPEIISQKLCYRFGSSKHRDFFLYIAKLRIKHAVQRPRSRRRVINPDPPPRNLLHLSRTTQIYHKNFSSHIC